MPGKKKQLPVYVGAMPLPCVVCDNKTLGGYSFRGMTSSRNLVCFSCFGKMERLRELLDAGQLKGDDGSAAAEDDSRRLL